MGMTLQLAKAMIEAAIEKADADYAQPICVSVCDTAGLLTAFNRVEGVPVRCVHLSQAKAYTAAVMGVDTDAFLERLQRENLSLANFCDPKMTALPGGVAVRNAAGEVIGGLGISGMKAEEDAAVARVAVEIARTFG